MSHFLIIGLSTEPAHDNRLFDSRIQLKAVVNPSIGTVCAGGRTEILPWLILVNGTSTDLVNQGAKRNRCSHLFIEGLGNVLHHQLSVPVILHFFHGMVEQEILPDCPKVTISLKEFSEIFPGIDENVRYVVLRETA